MKPFTVTNDEIAEFVEGIADRKTMQRVLLAALADPQTRKQIELLQHLDRIPSASAANASETTASSAERLLALQTLLKKSFISFMSDADTAVTPVAPPASAVSTATVVREQAQHLLRDTLRGGVLKRIANETAQGLSDEWDKAVEGMHSLFIGRSELLTLPCLAPGAAAYAADLQVQRQTVAVAEGVRIEFQQLPASALDRLRVMVDASALTAENQQISPYNVAFLTLEEGRGGTRAADTEDLPDRHILVIALNEEGRGYVDLTVTGGNVASVGGGGSASASDTTTGGANLLPAPRTAYSLLSATLSRRDN